MLPGVSTGYSVKSILSAPSPKTAAASRKRNPRRPPLVSTMAPKGIRSREPVSDGTETSRPSSVAPNPMAAPSVVLVGPKSEMAITPKKKPRVAPKRAEEGVPLSLNCDCTIMLDLGICYIVFRKFSICPVFRSVDITEQAIRRRRDIKGVHGAEQTFHA